MPVGHRVRGSGAAITSWGRSNRGRARASRNHDRLVRTRDLNYRPIRVRTHRRARRAPHPSLSPLTRGEGEQSQQFVPYQLVERRSSDLIDFIPLFVGIRQP